MSEGFNTPKTEETTTTWVTPRYIPEALGPFDFDPCCPDTMPWRTAKRMHHYPGMGDGLSAPWEGRVWLNPPYGEGMWPWVEKLAQHGNGTLLIFARSDTPGYHANVLGKAHSIFYFRGRLRFFNEAGVLPPGKNGKPSSPGAPSILASYSELDTQKIHTAWAFGDIKGTLRRNYA